MTTNDTPDVIPPCPSCGMTPVRRTGRPTKRSEPMIRELITLVASGTPVKDAARCIGINPTTL